MDYPVSCECGQVHRVAAALAGSHFACRCGRDVSVPSLIQLKSAAGQAVLSPEVRLEQMLQLGMLPEESRCLVCDAPTKKALFFWAMCERAVLKESWGQKWLGLVVLIFFFGWVGLLVGYLAGRLEGDKLHGREVRFRLPLRVCSECTSKVSVPITLWDTALAVPIYAELLRKYPDAQLVFDAQSEDANLSSSHRSR